MKANTIDEVISFLDEIITTAKKEKSRLGYFPALYRKVTIKVKKGIKDGIFNDGHRMEILDVNFANRYLEAYENYSKIGITTKSWKTAFDQCNFWRPIVLQHLLLGMNAHISLDLGIAAAESMRGKNLEDIKEDFNKINDILISMINEVQNDLAEVWPALKYLDKFGGNSDEKISGFGMIIARSAAWKVAEEMWKTPDAKWSDKIEEIDSRVLKISQLLERPRWKLSLILLWIRIRENQSVSDVIDMLS
jgi:hypothetical protein